jgi:mono/diheme cytochrome c family protein
MRIALLAACLLTACLLSLWASPVVADGKTLYESLCSACHGPQGLGDGAGVPENLLKPRPFRANAFKFDTDADWQKGTNQDIANVIRYGTAAYGGSTLMPPWSQLSDSDIEELVVYVRRLQN